MYVKFNFNTRGKEGMISSEWKNFSMSTKHAVRIAQEFVRFYGREGAILYTVRDY